MDHACRRRPSGPMLPLVLLAGLLTAAAAHAEVFRWRAADGSVHYGDQPPPDVQPETIPIDAAPPTRGAASDERRLLEDADRRAARSARERDQARAAEARAEAARTRRCTQLAERRRRLDDEFDERRAHGYTPAQERSYQRRLDELDRTLKRECP